MVGDLDHIDPGQLGVGREQGALGGWFEISEQQDGQPRGTHQQGDARVVRPLGRR